MSGWDEAGEWRWGKAGRRVTPAEIVERGRRRGLDRLREEMSQQRIEEDNRIAYRLWAAGQMVPDRITMCLDAQGLDGPEVDEQCGAAEPEVDLWEAGELYPTWEQVEKLAALCRVTPRFLMHDYLDAHRIDPRDTTLRFHLPAHAFEDDGPPVLRFREAAVRARMSGHPVTLPELPPRVRPGEQIPLFEP